MVMLVNPGHLPHLPQMKVRVEKGLQLKHHQVLVKILGGRKSSGITAKRR